jgi:cytidine deaminase
MTTTCYEEPILASMNEYESRAIRQAKNAAFRSAMLDRFGAVIYAPANGFVLGTGYNHRLRGIPMEYEFSSHAEMSALRKALKKYRIGSYGKWIMCCRHYNRSDVEKVAIPCGRCLEVLKAFDIDVHWGPF